MATTPSTSNPFNSPENKKQWLWFGAALVLLLVLSQTQPKLAGGLVLLIVTYLAVAKLSTTLAASGTSGTF